MGPKWIIYIRKEGIMEKEKRGDSSRQKKKPTPLRLGQKGGQAKKTKYSKNWET